jgi:hypothetical protein
MPRHDLRISGQRRGLATGRRAWENPGAGDDFAMADDVRTNIHEIEPGWTLITFDAPPEQDQSRLHVLLNVLQAWRLANPTHRVENLRIERCKGLVRGLHAFWSVFDHRPADMPQLEFQIDAALRQQLGSEYLEALIVDATRFFYLAEVQHARAAMISKRRVAILVDRRNGQGAVLGMDQLLSRLPAEQAQIVERDFQEWLANEAQGYLCLGLPESFSLPNAD